VLHAYVTLPKKYHFVKAHFVDFSDGPLEISPKKLLYGVWFIPAGDMAHATEILADLKNNPEYDFHF